MKPDSGSNSRSNILLITVESVNNEVHLGNAFLRFDEVVYEWSFALDCRLDGIFYREVLWYYENYWIGFSKIHKRRSEAAVQAMKSYGLTLFEQLMKSCNDEHPGRLIGEKVDQIDIRISKVDGIESSVLWEFLTDSIDENPFIISAKSFGRIVNSGNTACSGLECEKIRLLYVISRPQGVEDVKYTGVINSVVHSDFAEYFQFSVLRPPTYEAFCRELKRAKDSGEPYHVVHFDGHGAVFDICQSSYSSWIEEPEIRKLGENICKVHGYVFFESENYGESQPIPGYAIGEQLRSNECRALVVNACQSASVISLNPQIPVSFAEQVSITANIPVIGMQFSAIVDTANIATAEIYRALGNGESVVSAAREARKALYSDSVRIVDDQIKDYDDVYNVVCFASNDVAFQPNDYPKGKTYSPFFGRDEEIIRVERCLQENEICLVSGGLGIGKTAFAKAFMRWRCLTVGSSSLSGAYFSLKDPNALLEARKWVDRTVTMHVEGLLIIDDFQQIELFAESARHELIDFINSLSERSERIKLLNLATFFGDFPVSAKVEEICMQPLALSDLAKCYYLHKTGDASRISGTQYQSFSGLLKATFGFPAALQPIAEAIQLEALGSQLKEDSCALSFFRGERALKFGIQKTNHLFEQFRLFKFSETEKAFLELLTYFQNTINVNIFFARVIRAVDGIPPSIHRDSLNMPDDFFVQVFRKLIFSGLLSPLSHCEHAYIINPLFRPFICRFLNIDISRSIIQKPSETHDLSWLFTVIHSEFYSRLVAEYQKYNMDEFGICQILRNEQSNLWRAAIVAFKSSINYGLLALRSMRFYYKTKDDWLSWILLLENQFSTFYRNGEYMSVLGDHESYAECLDFEIEALINLGDPKAIKACRVLVGFRLARIEELKTSDWADLSAEEQYLVENHTKALLRAVQIAERFESEKIIERILAVRDLQRAFKQPQNKEIEGYLGRVAVLQNTDQDENSLTLQIKAYEDLIDEIPITHSGEISKSEVALAHLYCLRAGQLLEDNNFNESSESSKLIEKALFRVEHALSISPRGSSWLSAQALEVKSRILILKREPTVSYENASHAYQIIDDNTSANSLKMYLLKSMINSSYAALLEEQQHKVSNLDKIGYWQTILAEHILTFEKAFRYYYSERLLRDFVDDVLPEIKSNISS